MDETLLVAALFGPLSLLMIAVVAAMVAGALRWLRAGQVQLAEVRGGLGAIRAVGYDLPERHPIRTRLEAAPVAELSLEELAHMLVDTRAGRAARALLQLEHQLMWIERFAQFAVHLGILGTVLSLTTADVSDLEGFRASLPLALGTTFWGLLGALTLSAAAGRAEGVLTAAQQELRLGVLGAWDDDAPAKGAPMEEPAP